MKTLLVTGGAGFIGSNFIRYILNKYAQYKIINYDLLTYAGNLNYLLDISKDSRYDFVKGDIADVRAIKRLFDNYNIDYVINFAAESHVDNSIKNPGVFVKTNILGTQVLLDAARASWQIGKDEFGYPKYREGVKYLQISTDEVYGSLGKNGLFNETAPLLPNSPYSASKAGADMLVRAYGETYNLPINITRCSNNYGPYQFEEKLIPLMITNALNNKPLPVYGDGLQIRDWLYVGDHCLAIDMVLHKGQVKEVYNIGGNNERTNLEIVKLILKILGKSDSLISHVEDRLGHDRRYAIDNHKIKTKLGWEPKYDFEKGMKETIEWYKNRFY